MGCKVQITTLCCPHKENIPNDLFVNVFVMRWLEDQLCMTEQKTDVEKPQISGFALQSLYPTKPAVLSDAL